MELTAVTVEKPKGSIAIVWNRGKTSRKLLRISICVMKFIKIWNSKHKRISQHKHNLLVTVIKVLIKGR